MSTKFDRKFISLSETDNHMAILVLTTKGCLSLFNYFIDMSPTLMSPFFEEENHVFLTKNGLIKVGLMYIE